MVDRVPRSVEFVYQYGMPSGVNLKLVIWLIVLVDYMPLVHQCGNSYCLSIMNNTSEETPKGHITVVWGGWSIPELVLPLTYCPIS